MFYYLCKRCNHMTKQKIEMRRHLIKDGVQNNIINNNQKIINININYLKGFDEEWDVSKIDDKKKVKFY